MKRNTPHRWARARTVAVMLVAAFGLVGCQMATEPVTGRSQFILTSPQAEMQMSLQAWGDILKEEKQSTNRAMIAAVERVGGAISATVEQPGFQWEFRVFADPQANAFCLPGGKVGVYEGLFKYVDNDAELAAVVGHEIGHALARHGGERMTQALVLNLGAIGLSAAMSDKEKGDRERWLAAYTGVGMLGIILPYSRTHEYAADEIGLVYMAKAGYDPHAALTFWRKFMAADSGPRPPEFLSTHPVGANRLQRLQRQLPRAIVEYELAPVRRGLGETYRR